MSSARSASTATASAPSRAAVPARASAPKPAPGVTVDVVLPAERAIFTLEHVDAGAREICVALGPFRRAIAFVGDALDGRGGVFELQPIENPTDTADANADFSGDF